MKNCTKKLWTQNRSIGKTCKAMNKTKMRDARGIENSTVFLNSETLLKIVTSKTLVNNFNYQIHVIYNSFYNIIILIINSI